MRSISWLLAAVLILSIIPECIAQPADSGVVALTEWPAAAQEPYEHGRAYPFDLLPFIDSLSVDYRYGVADDRPRMHFVLSWLPGTEGILNRERVSYDRLPGDIRIERLHLHADVLVDGRAATELQVRVDSLMLPPRPASYAFTADSLDWATLFSETPADSARRYFEEGFRLANLRIDHIAFAVFEPRPQPRSGDGERRPPPPPRVDVYPVDIHIHAGWFFPGGRDDDDAYKSPRTERPRSGVTRTRSGDRASDGERTTSRSPGDTGRTSNDRSRGGTSGERDDEDDGDREARSDRDRSRSGERDDDEDEDDDTSLAPTAIGAAVAVGAIAVAGGTVGYYANTGDMPVGLQAGYVQPNGGAVLQAAVNRDVLTGGDEERLLAKIIGFGDLFDLPVQPALGAGVLVTALGDDVDIQPTFSLGLVANLGRVVLMAGYDVQTEGLDVGLAVNFRYRSRTER